MDTGSFVNGCAGTKGVGAPLHQRRHRRRPRPNRTGRRSPQSHGIRPGRRRRSGLSKRGLPEKEVPVSVAAWVVKGRTAKQAADQILSKADQLTDHLLTLRTLRLKAKAQIRAQAAKGKMDLARGAADEALLAIRELLGGLSG